MENAKAGRKVRDMAYISLFAALIAISTWIYIPAVIPFTMQVFAVFAAFATLGGKRGTLAVTVYLLLGAVGLPVFSGFRGGIAVLLGPTGGYVAGFVLSGMLYGCITARFGDAPAPVLLALFSGLLLCYAFGTLYFVLISGSGLGASSLRYALSVCVLPFLLPDILKIILAYFCARKFKRFVK